ncbi:LLM class flavin-dependent oxidoreductase [Actinomadura sp. 3N407]|uniref:LLM class flavin-dependent oxidoreductase n=1 Tax=Actinomadura sp. 3N407 TaxID=3457423 RepID=UPI003FCEB504
MTVSSGSTVADAVRTTTELACLAQRLGFHRMWVAEHHSMPNIGSSPPTVLSPYARAGEPIHWQCSPPMHMTIRDSAQKRFRRLRPDLCGLLAPARPSPHVPESAHAPALHEILARQRPALRAAGDRIRTPALDGRLPTTEQNILESRTHMQANRLLGVESAKEEMSVRLWTLTVRALAAMPNASPLGNPS